MNLGLLVDAAHERQCMDEKPATECWTSSHYAVYMLPAVIFCGPYYLMALHFQTSAAMQQSVIAIDGVCGIVSFQSKVFLVFISQIFGDCHPLVLVMSIELVVFIQVVIMFFWRSYSSVLQINAIRTFGFAAASLNGLFAGFMIHSYGAKTSCADIFTSDLAGTDGSGRTGSPTSMAQPATGSGGQQK